ncbi:coiled-coil domain-containing protein 134-like isoform X2 [Dendronephthya gigantea]|nr:coiled-coil domain-containing protein 134-like isoform X2 [Dendronephthya gigantea]
MVAVENVLKLNDYEKQYKILNMIFEKLFKIIQEAKKEVTTSGYNPGDEFPVEQKQKEAIGHIVENTALLGDVVLRLPDITKKLFSKNKEWKLLTLWSLSFTNSTTIYDETDSKLLSLMAQELKLIPRDPNYFNPFTEESKRKIKKSIKEEDPISSNHENKSHKKKKPRGPRLSHGEL